MAGQNPSMVIRIAANLDELKRNLAEGRVQIETTTAAMNKIVASLQGDKLIQHAHNVTAAVNQIGGASKLTEAEMVRVHAIITKALEKYAALGKEAPPAMRALAEATADAGRKTDSFWGSLGQVKSLLGALGITVTLAGLVAFGKELLRTGDELVRVADRTGLTTIEVQRLQYIARQSGNSIDELTGGLGQLQQRLVRGSDGVVEAVRNLGINFQALRAASPYDQLVMVAEAVVKIPDPTQRAALMTELFGRTGIVLLPTLISKFKELGDAAPVMSDKTVRALDQAGDQLQTFSDQVKVWAAESYNFLGRAFDQLGIWIDQFAARTLNATASLLEMTGKLPGATWAMDKLGISTAGMRQQAQWFTDSAGATRARLDTLEVATRTATTTVVEFGESLKDTKKSTDVAAKAMQTFTVELGHNLAAVRSLEIGAKQLTGSIAQWQFQLEDTGREMVDVRLKALAMERDVVVGVGHIGEAVEDMGPHVKKAFSSFGEDLPNLIIGAFQGGGDVVKTLGAALGNELAKSLTTGMEKGFQTSAVSAGLTLGLSAYLEWSIAAGKARFEAEMAKMAAMDAVMRRMQALADVGIDLEQVLAGASGASQIATILDEVEAAIERMTELRATAETTAQKMSALRAVTPGLRIALDGVYNAKTPQEYADAIKRVNDEVDIAIGKQQALDTALGNLKTSWEILGPTARAQYLGEWATGVQKDIENVVGAGADLNYTIGLAGPEFSKIVQAAKRSGTEIPAALRPVLEQAARLGVLFDEDGKKITDLKGFGVSFGTTFEQSMVEVRDAMLDVVDALRDIKDALLGIPNQRTIEITVRQKLESIGSSIEEKLAIVTAAGKPLKPTPQFAGGTGGRFFDFGAGTDVRVHGRERISTEAEGRAEAMNMKALEAALNGVRSDLIRRLPHMIATAVRDAMAMRRAA